MIQIYPNVSTLGPVTGQPITFMKYLCFQTQRQAYIFIIFFGTMTQYFRPMKYVCRCGFGGQ